ncbi:hypothetical protein TNCV_3448651 [Trichonephila clavipes]|nr:hypothetical protein TNCV_3448651 [Trichonephila clavipes]
METLEVWAVAPSYCNYTLSIFLKSSGRCSLVVKVTNSYPACHVLESGAAECPPLEEADAKTSFRWCGVTVRRGCRPRHLIMVQNNEVRRQKPSSS